MPYEVEKSIRRVPAALWSLLRASGLSRGGGTTEEADAWGRQRTDELPRSSGPVMRAGERVLGAAGLYPLPDETKGQFQDAVMGGPEQWFPTAGLARRARGVTPKDTNLTDELAGGKEASAFDPRWKQFAQEQKGRR